jgi:hypothetical protein
VLTLASFASLGYMSSFLLLVATLLYYPSIYFGLDYWKGVGWILGVVVVVIFVVIVVANGGKAFEQLMRWWRVRKKPLTDRIEVMMEGAADRPSILVVAKKYVESHTEGFCAGIEIVAPAATSYANRSTDVGGFEVVVPIVEVSVSEKKVSVPVDYIKIERVPGLPAWYFLALMALITYFVFLIMTSIYESNADVEPVWEGVCVISSWDKQESSIFANVTCKDKHTKVNDAETLLSYVNNKNNPYCFADKNDKLYCKIGDKKRMK